MKSYITDRSEISINFKYPDFNDSLFVELRKMTNINLDNLSEIDKMREISGYAHSLFSHGNDKSSLLNPITIIEEARKGKSFRCVEHSFLGAGLLWAYGIPARTIGLKTKDVETREVYAGHYTIEFWNYEFKKWIMIDVQFGIIPKYKEGFLSAFELGEKLDQGLPVKYIPIVKSRFSSEKNSKEYTEWIHKYLYFFDTFLNLKLNTTEENRFSDKRVMLIPLGVNPPKVFQRIFPINAIYTHSVLDFYSLFQNKI
ncbi:hypothetical protein E3V08_06165 [Candidatus Atribacteria bacterium MT.SAG.1]|nr:hypothetical protein E3V08_06165 [Candidatus Atribacteria bacterium MT.SAG.1]